MAGFEIAKETSVQDAIQNLIEVLNRIGITSDGGATDTTGTLMGKSNKVLEVIGTGISSIKSIQTILIKNLLTGSAADEFGYTYVDFSISDVNKEKTILIVERQISDRAYSFGMSRLISNNTIRIYSNNNYAVSIDNLIIQVVEFN